MDKKISGSTDEEILREYWIALRENWIALLDRVPHGSWKAIVTFQQILAFSDDDGLIDMAPSDISNRTSIPVEIIEEGMECIEKWGWIVPNQSKWILPKWIVPNKKLYC